MCFLDAGLAAGVQDRSRSHYVYRGSLASQLCAGGELLQDYGTLLLLIFPSPAIVFNISLLRQAIRTVPYDLLDSARSGISHDKPHAGTSHRPQNDIGL